MEVVKLQFKSFDWDNGNIQKAQKHGVSLEEIENFFEQDLLVLQDQRHSTSELRFISVGTSKQGRTLFIAFTLRNKETETYLRVISARYAHKKEKEIYEKIKKNLKK